MNKTTHNSLLTVGLLIGTLVMSDQVSAGLVGDVVIDFEGDDATGTQMPAAVFPAFGQSYIEDGVVHTAIGFDTSPGNSLGVGSGGTSHLHGTTSGENRFSFLEPDSGGGLFQLADGMAFSAKSMDISALSLDLVGGGASTVTFRGYKDSALTDTVDLSIDKNVGSSLDFGDTFNSVYLLEYFFDASGRGNDPSTNAAFSNLKIGLDNVVLGAPVINNPEPPPSNVPVPAAVWFFVSAIGGLGFMRKKKLT